MGLPSCGSTRCRSTRTARTGSGFTMVEVLLSIVVMGLAAGAIGQAFTSARGMIAARLERAQIDSLMRNRMEFLLASPFGSLAGGSQNVSVSGKTLALSWGVTGADLNGDATPEPSAVLITITLGERTLRCIVTDHTGPARPIKLP